jgi:hypothetical protein
MPKGVLESSNQMSTASQQQFIVEQMTKGMMTAMPVIVMGVNSPDNELIDVTPAIGQENANGDSVDHNVIYNVPVCRLQRGNSAVIMRPVVGDKGLVVFATQDISIFKKVKKFCKAGTFARHDWSSAIYVMGLCNTAPTQYIEFNDNDITIVTPKLIINGNIETTGTIKSNGHIIDNTHTHSGVQTGGGTTGQVS